MEYGADASLPAWECGLKYLLIFLYTQDYNVTPCVGVWIEIYKRISAPIAYIVTPCVGVWIEILAEFYTMPQLECHSLRGSVD